MKSNLTLVFAGVLAGLLAGCAGEKSKIILQRGWIGGDYVLAKRESAWVRLCDSPGVSGTLPQSVPEGKRTAIEITELAPNTPAAEAGLRKGDFVLELNHRPITSLQAFRRTIDRSAPGTSLTVQVYRDDLSTEYQVPMGREKYKNGGHFSVTLPTVVHRWDLWPNPGFSLVCVGYEPNPGLRHELGKAHEVYDEKWSAYAGFMEFSCGERVVAQEQGAVGNPAPDGRGP